MAIRAFHGDPAIKEGALARLRRHVEAGTFRFGPAWSEQGASALGAAIEGDDPRIYSERLGYPLPLVLILDAIVNEFPNLAEAASFAEAWLERTPVGGDLSRIVPETLIAILDDPSLAQITARAPRVEQARQAVLDLHRRALGGEEVTREQWKTARSAALAANDEEGLDRVVRAAGSVAEAAAWPAATRTVLKDATAARGGLDLKLALAEIGWTDDDERRVFRIMEAAAGRMTDLEGLERVLAILDADHPELALHFRERLDKFDALSSASVALGQDILLRLAAAPVLHRDASS